jgi:hypothetical protein
MEAEWSTDRANLRLAVRDHPDWSVAELAQRLGRSATWVKKWRRRLQAAPPGDELVLHSQSRARQHPPPAPTRSPTSCHSSSASNSPSARMAGSPGTSVSAPNKHGWPPLMARYFGCWRLVRIFSCQSWSSSSQGSTIPRGIRTQAD